MESTRKSSLEFGTIAWGALFILWGLTEMFTTLPKGIGALGIGVIMVGLNLARYWTGQRVSRFSMTLGVLALLLGGLELAQPYLHLSFELPIFAILLLALGAMLLGQALFTSKG